MLKLITRMSKLFAIFNLNVLHNYFDDPTKLYSDLTKFLNISIKPFFL